MARLQRLVVSEMNTQGYGAKSAPNPGLNGFQGLRPENTKHGGAHNA